MKTILKFVAKTINYFLFLTFLCFAFLLAYEWLVPWYCDAYQIECKWENMYEKNDRLLPGHPSED